MADLSSIVARFKDNKKILIPAAIGGVALGAFVLLRKGGVNGGLVAEDPITKAQALVDKAAEQAQAAAGGGGGGTSPDSGAIAMLQAQQQSFANSLVDQFNKFAESVSSAFSGQQDQNASAINDIAGQLQDQIANASNQQGQAGGLTDFLPDFGALYAAAQQSYGQQSAIPNIPLSAQSLSATLNKITTNPIKVGGRVTPAINLRPVQSQGTQGRVAPALSSLGALSGYKVSSSVKGTIKPSYSSSSITSSGGFGTNNPGAAARGAAKNTANLAKRAGK